MKKTEDGVYRRLSNAEAEENLQEGDTVIKTEAERMRWYGDVYKRQHTHTQTKITEAK